MLTKKEKELISQAACDIETGNHLLRPRSKDQLEMLNKVFQALSKADTKHMKEILEYYRYCTTPPENNHV